eukprot:11804405-Heterocapsa_arctica.AAC.1
MILCHYGIVSRHNGESARTERRMLILSLGCWYLVQSRAQPSVAQPPLLAWPSLACRTFTGPLIEYGVAGSQEA